GQEVYVVIGGSRLDLQCRYDAGYPFGRCAVVLHFDGIYLPGEADYFIAPEGIGVALERSCNPNSRVPPAVGARKYGRVRHGAAVGIALSAGDDGFREQLDGRVFVFAGVEGVELSFAQAGRGELQVARLSHRHVGQREGTVFPGRRGEEVGPDWRAI